MRPLGKRSWSGSSDNRNSKNNSNNNSHQQHKRKYFHHGSSNNNNNNKSKNNTHHYPQAKRYNAKEMKIEELYAYMVEPHVQGSHVPKITRVLTLLPIQDVRLDFPKSYQPSVVITTTDGRKYRRNPRTNRVMEPAKKFGHYVFSIWNDTVTYGGYLDEEGCVHVQMRQVGTSAQTKGTPVWQKVGFERPRNYPPVKIVQLVLSGPTFVALSEGGNVFMWNENNRAKTQRPSSVASLCDVDIVQIAGSDSLVAALTNDGIVYTWLGADIHHGDDNAWDNELIYVPTRSDHVSSSVQQIGCGNNRLVALDHTGREIYCLPDGEASDKGIIYRPLEKVSSISCGETSCLALSEDGRVFAWGSDFSSEDPDREHHLDFFDDLEPQKIECAGQCLLVLTRFKHTSNSASNTTYASLAVQEETTTTSTPIDSMTSKTISDSQQGSKKVSQEAHAHQLHGTSTPSSYQRNQDRSQLQNHHTSTKRHSSASPSSQQSSSISSNSDGSHLAQRKKNAGRSGTAAGSGGRQLIPMSEEEESGEEIAKKKSLVYDIPVADLLRPDEHGSSAADYWTGRQLQHDPTRSPFQEVTHFSDRTPAAYHAEDSSEEATPHGFTKVHDWMSGKWTALTAKDLERYALALVHHGFNSVELLKEMLTPTHLAKCLQDSKGNSLSPQHIHFQYICKQLKKEGLDGFAT